MTVCTAGPSQEGATASITLDVARIDILYCSIIQCRSFSTGDLMVTDEAASVPSIAPTFEQTRLQLEVTSEPVSAPAISSALVNTILVVITSLYSLALVVKPEPMITSPTSLVASMLVSMSTPPQLLPIFSAQLTTALVTPSTIVTTKLTETFSVKITHLPGVVEVVKEFVAEMAATFYKSLKQCISLVLKGSTVLLSF